MNWLDRFLVWLLPDPIHCPECGEQARRIECAVIPHGYCDGCDLVFYGVDE